MTRAWQIASRVLAASVGGHVLANVVAVALAHGLRGPSANAVMGAVLASFLIHLVVIVWAFGARSVRNVWLGMAAVFAASLAWIGLVGGAA